MTSRTEGYSSRGRGLLDSVKSMAVVSARGAQALRVVAQREVLCSSFGGPERLSFEAWLEVAQRLTM